LGKGGPVFRPPLAPPVQSTSRHAQRVSRGARPPDRVPGPLPFLTSAPGPATIRLAFCGNSSVGRASACHAEGRRFESGFPLCFRSQTYLPAFRSGFAEGRFFVIFRICPRPRSQVVRRRSAKPLFGGSNPPGASVGQQLSGGCAAIVRRFHVPASRSIHGGRSTAVCAARGRAIAPRAGQGEGET
jgi:hypothetical protein